MKLKRNEELKVMSYMGLRQYKHDLWKSYKGKKKIIKTISLLCLGRGKIYYHTDSEQPYLSYQILKGKGRVTLQIKIDNSSNKHAAKLTYRVLYNKDDIFNNDRMVFHSKSKFILPGSWTDVLIAHINEHRDEHMVADVCRMNEVLDAEKAGLF